MEQRPPANRVTAPARPSRPILLVDDNPAVREAMEAVLIAHGYGVVPAADGTEALERLHGGLEPCLILLDMLMPRMDGVQFRMEQIRDARFADIPTLAYSADGNQEAKAVKLGLPFFRKPTDFEPVLDLVARHALQD
jgi:CheY-like chemotaxis protein